MKGGDDPMLRDRGKMKWQGFFMTEHVKLLWDMEEEYLRTARPLLDEGQIEDLEGLLSLSLLDKSYSKSTQKR